MSDEDVSQSSSTPEPASTASVTTPESATPAASPSSAEPQTGDSGQQAKDTLLDAVLKVVPATTEKDVLADSEATASPETPDSAEDEKAEAKSEDDDDAEPPAEANHKELRRKIRQLLNKNHARKQQVQELETQLTQSRSQTEIGAQLENFARQNDLSSDDIVQGLEAMAALRHGDWETFYGITAQPMRHAQEYLGHALPADLRDAVQKGQMTEIAARSYARLRMDQQRSEQARMVEQTNYAQAAHQQTQAQVERSVNAYEAQIAATDPDYKRKANFVKLAVQAKLLERGGHIQTVEDALQITKTAYDEVNGYIRKLRPQLQATAPQPNGNGSTRSARAEPTTLFEAALQGLERSRNGAAT